MASQFLWPRGWTFAVYQVRKLYVVVNLDCLCGTNIRCFFGFLKYFKDGDPAPLIFIEVG